MTSKAKVRTTKAGKATAEGTIVPKRGAPPKYEPWMCDAIIEVAAEGGHIAAMCVKIGIRSEDTFHRWKKEIPEFGAAYDEARLVSKAVYETRLMQGSMGFIPGFNATAFAMLMNNKFPEDYKRGANGNSTAPSTTEITINQLSLSNNELRDKINQKLELLKIAGFEMSIPGITHDTE